MVSRDVKITMMFMLEGGSRHHLGVLFIISRNERRSYQINGVPNNVPGVSYRSGPKEWIDSRVFAEWLSEKSVMGLMQDGPQRILILKILPVITSLLR